MNRKAVFLLLGLFVAQISCAYAESVKDELNHKYKKQVLSLRAPFVHGDQRFDSSGHSLNDPPKGPWSTYGGIFVEKLSLSPDTLRLEGPRVAPIGDKEGRPAVVPLGKSVKVEIHLDRPLNLVDEARAVLGRVFFLDDDKLQHAKPEYRRSDAGNPGESLYHVGIDDTKAPVAKYMPEPGYSPQASKAKLSGTVLLNVVLDKTGRVSRIRIDKALGMGLDENAVESVKGWGFAPATRNGQPVAVEMAIEVSFNIY